jgi:hypothetical protein
MPHDFGDDVNQSLAGPPSAASHRSEDIAAECGNRARRLVVLFVCVIGG